MVVLGRSGSLGQSNEKANDIAEEMRRTRKGGEKAGW